VRYVATTIHAVLKQAVKAGLLARNAADAATPPSAGEAKAPEMHPRSAGQLAAFLRWAEDQSRDVALWTVLAMTGMRRGEALSLRWRDIDLDGACIRIRRNAGATGLLWTVAGAPGPLTCAVRLARTRDGQIAVLTRRGMEE
jgi:integrase